MSIRLRRVCWDTHFKATRSWLYGCLVINFSTIFSFTIVSLAYLSFICYFRFYIEDCFAAGFILLRTYVYMSLVSKSSDTFLKTMDDYLVLPISNRKQLMKVVKSLKSVSLNVGPCPISRLTVLTVLNTLGNYYVCAALW